MIMMALVLRACVPGKALTFRHDRGRAVDYKDNVDLAIEAGCAGLALLDCCARQRPTIAIPIPIPGSVTVVTGSGRAPMGPGGVAADRTAAALLAGEVEVLPVAGVAFGVAYS